ncbi:MAG: DUF1080 domain-containing protein [Akkermansiaceae bacterium]
MKKIITAFLISISTLAFAEDHTSLLGKDLSNWTFITKEGEKDPSIAWKLKNGVLSTTGEPIGYLRTKENYKNYTLTYEWRWMPDSEKNNSGLLVHVGESGAAGVWPKCFEAQLMQGNAGDFWAIGESLEATGENQKRRWIRITDPAEKPLGEWNKMTVKCSETEITVHVNGTLVNKGTKLSTNQGAIGFQSEGKTIEIRKVILKD